jgi:hypothetical protein
MFVVPKHDREWVAWIKEEVAHRRLPCMAGCGTKATKIKLVGKRSGAFCGSCYGEIYYGNIPKLDRPKGLKRARRRH